MIYVGVKKIMSEPWNPGGIYFGGKTDLKKFVDSLSKKDFTELNKFVFEINVRSEFERLKKETEQKNES